MVGDDNIRILYEDGVQLHKVHKLEYKWNMDTNK